MADNTYPGKNEITKELEDFWVLCVKIVNDEGWFPYVLVGVLLLLVSLESILFASVGAIA